MVLVPHEALCFVKEGTRESAELYSWAELLSHLSQMCQGSLILKFLVQQEENNSRIQIYYICIVLSLLFHLLLISFF